MIAVYTATAILTARTPTCSGQLELADSRFEILSALRHLKDRRSTLLVRGIDDEQLLVLKLFVARGKGQQEFTSELAAHAHCQAQQIAVADIVRQLNNVQGISAIAYNYLPNAKTLAQLDFAEQPITALFEIFAYCHQANCYQQDPHLDNFAWSQGRLYLLDLASVRIQNKPLPMSVCMHNLAQLLVQWPEHNQQAFRNGLLNYFKTRRQDFTEQIAKQLATFYQKARIQHRRHYLKKQLRNCTMTVYQKTLWCEAAWRKGAVNSLPADQLEALMQTGQPLKTGNSATVVVNRLDGQPVVVKRYNMKNVGHWLRRCLRPSRARSSWLNANLLEYAGISTPQPLGFVEVRRLGLRHRAYFISRHVAGRPLLDLSDDELLAPSLQLQLEDLFTGLRQQQLVHGDMKANNLLVDEHGKLWLIDLDAMCQVSSDKFADLHQQDTNRFLQNWRGRNIITQLKKVIETACD